LNNVRQKFSLKLLSQQELFGKTETNDYLHIIFVVPPKEHLCFVWEFEEEGFRGVKYIEK